MPDVPGEILPTEPGDVIAFDPLLYHASWAGRDRHQWSTLYLRDAITPSSQQDLIDWYDDGASDIDELPEGWRPFDRTWVAGGSGDNAERGSSSHRLAQRHTWMYRFNQLGVLDRFGIADAYRP